MDSCVQRRSDITSRDAIDLNRWTIFAHMWLGGRSAPCYSELLPLNDSAALCMLSIATDCFSRRLTEPDAHGLFHAMLAHGLVRIPASEPAQLVRGSTLQESRLAMLVADELKADELKERDTYMAERAATASGYMARDGAKEGSRRSSVQQDAPPSNPLWRLLLASPRARMPTPIADRILPPRGAWQHCLRCGCEIDAFGMLASCVSCFRGISKLLAQAMCHCERDIDQWALLVAPNSRHQESVEGAQVKSSQVKSSQVKSSCHQESVEGAPAVAPAPCLEASGGARFDFVNEFGRHALRADDPAWRSAA